MSPSPRLSTIGRDNGPALNVMARRHLSAPTAYPQWRNWYPIGGQSYVAYKLVAGSNLFKHCQMTAITLSCIVGVAPPSDH